MLKKNVVCGKVGKNKWKTTLKIKPLKKRHLVYGLKKQLENETKDMLKKNVVCGEAGKNNWKTALKTCLRKRYVSHGWNENRKTTLKTCLKK